MVCSIPKNKHSDSSHCNGTPPTGFLCRFSLDSSWFCVLAFPSDFGAVNWIAPSIFSEGIREAPSFCSFKFWFLFIGRISATQSFELVLWGTVLNFLVLEHYAWRFFVVLKDNGVICLVLLRNYWVILFPYWYAFISFIYWVRIENGGEMRVEVAVNGFWLSFVVADIYRTDCFLLWIV